VFTLAVLLFVGGVAMVLVAGDGIWADIGSAFVGGSVVGLVFAIVQHTLDLLSVERQASVDVRHSVSATRQLQGIDLAGASLASAYLWQKDLAHAHMDGAVLTAASLHEANLTGASLVGAGLRRADLRNARLAEADLDGADLAGARLTGAGLAGASLVGAGLRGADLSDLAESARVDLSGAAAEGAHLTGARLPGVRASFLAAAGADAADAVLAGGDLACADLRGANLRDADLTGADLSGADLGGAVLVRARLDGARLVGARLERADLTGATVDGADLRASDLRGSYLTNVDLAAATLTGAWVRSADLAPVQPPGGRGWSGLCLVDGAEPAAAAGRLAPSPEAAAGERAGPPCPERVVVAPAPGSGPEVAALAEAVAARLALRRRHLDALNDDVEAIHLRDAPPHYGDPCEHGLPRRADAATRPPARVAWVELRPTAAGLEVLAHRHRPTGASAGAGAPSPVTILVPPPASTPGGPAGAAPATAAAGAADAGRVASGVQVALAEPPAFAGLDELDRFAGWLDDPAADLEPVLDDVLAANPRNPVALVLRSWRRHASDVGQMTEAVRESAVAWAASGSAVGRAMAATKLAQAQSQIRHRATSGAAALARSRAAGVAAGDQLAPLARYAGLAGYDRAPAPGLPDVVRRGLDTVRTRALLALAAAGRRPVVGRVAGLGGLGQAVRDRQSLERLLILRLKAVHAHVLARFVTEEPDDLGYSIDQLRAAMRPFVRAGLPIGPTTRNYLAYCLMTSAGRFTRGVGPGYGEAAEHLRAVLATFGVSVDDPAAGRTAADMAAAFAAGEPPPTDPDLRQRVVRLALANLGNICRLTKDDQGALDCYGAALYCDPDYIEAYGERAWAHLDRGRAAEAEADMAAMLGRRVGTPQQQVRILLGYVDALARVGREADQGPWLRRAHDLDPEDQRVAARLAAWDERYGGVSAASAPA
jgi:uncharacterized protein YjbI with pentapeptide repeats